MNLELIGALNELEKERGISKEILLDAIESAVVTAYKKNYGANSNMSVRVDMSEANGEIRVYSRREVVEKVEDDTLEITLEDAQLLDHKYQLGDITEEEVTPKDFGRIAAQTAKQVVIQRIREAERSMVFNEYANRAGDVVVGVIHRVEHRNVVIDLGKVEAVLPVSEQIADETYKPSERMRFYINEVKQSNKGPQIFLSRTHPGLLKYLFEVEVPEIQSGMVEIKAVAREAGNRSKIAVFSRDPNVDPVGACVGARGSRVQAVVNQLNGEKIDIVEFVTDSKQLIANALSPADVVYVNLDEKSKTARTVVPDDQLSLAIGKEGQNARLAARLTSWRIDIKSETQAKDAPLFQLEEEEVVDELVEIEIISDDQYVEPDVSEDVKVESQDPVEESTPENEALKTLANEALLAKITNVKKRKSWEERFGSVTIKDDEELEEEKTNENKAKSDKKKDKQEKVFKDFSMLDLDDFKFTNGKK